MESAMPTTDQPSFATDPGHATVQADICQALASIASDRREWPKLLHEHLVKILELRFLEEQATTKRDKKRHHDLRNYYENYWQYRERQKRSYRENKDQILQAHRDYRENNKEELADYWRGESTRRAQKVRDKRKQQAEQGDWSGVSQGMLVEVKGRSKKKNAWDEPFDLTQEWILHQMERQGFRCPITGVPYWPYGVFQPSVDRIDSSRGYTIENCQVTSWFYNWLKNGYENIAAQKMTGNILDVLCFYWPQKKQEIEYLAREGKVEEDTYDI